MAKTGAKKQAKTKPTEKKGSTASRATNSKERSSAGSKASGARPAPRTSAGKTKATGNAKSGSAKPAGAKVRAGAKQPVNVKSAGNLKSGGTPKPSSDGKLSAKHGAPTKDRAGEKPAPKKSSPAAAAKGQVKGATSKPAAQAAAESKKKPARKKSRSRSLGARSVAEAASEASADAQGYVYINGRRVRMISAGGSGAIRKARAARKAAEEAAEVQAVVKPSKTKLTAKELGHYKSVLLEKRAELVGDVSAMEEAALRSRGDNLSNLPIHMADIGTDTFDQDFMLGLAETERKQLREIDDALNRIEDKTYGVCALTGNTIPKTRLDAKPWAKYTIEAARLMEGQIGVG